MTPYELDALALSTLLAALTVVVCFPLAVWMASRFARRGRLGRWVLDAMVLLPLALSPAVVGWVVVGLWWGHTHPGPAALATAGSWPRLVPEGLVVANMILTLPLMVRTLRPAFEAVDHTQVLVARSLGATRWRAWWTVTAAQTAPLMASAVALGFAAAWGECGAAIVVVAALQGAAGGAPADTVFTVPMTLVSAMQTERGHEIAMRMALCSLGVAVLAIVTSEWTHRRWRRRALPPEARGVAA